MIFVSIGLQIFTVLNSIKLLVSIDLQQIYLLNPIDLQAPAERTTKIQYFTPLIFFKIGQNMI